MDLRELLNIYKDYSYRQGLKPFYHRTSLAMLIVRIGKLLMQCSYSNDKFTDNFTDTIKKNAESYILSADFIDEYHDVSKLYTLKSKDKAPSLFIDNLADLFIELMIYIGGNDLVDEFIQSLEQKLVNDKSSSFSRTSRFRNNRNSIVKN